MKAQIVAIIQARLNSQRLPRKVLLPLGSSTVIETILERVKQAQQIDRIIVAVNSTPGNQELIDFLEAHQLPFVASQTAEDDVLARYYDVATQVGAQHICRITADCPLIDPAIIDQTLIRYQNKVFDYVANNHPRATFPDGMDTEVFSYATLQKAFQEAHLKSEREHVTPYIWKHPDQFRLDNVVSEIDYANYRVTLDEAADYQVIQQIYQQFAEPSMSDIIHFLAHNEDIRAQNQHIHRDEGYQKSLAQE